MWQKIVICGILISLIWAKPVVGQVDLKIRPIALAFLTVNAGAEVIKAPFWGVDVAGSFRQFSIGNEVINSVGYDEIFTRNLRGHLTGKFYLNPRDGGDRLFVGIYGRYLNSFQRFQREVLGPTGGVVDQITTSQRHRASLGLAAGYKFVSAKRFLVEVDGGIGRAIVDNTVSDDPVFNPTNNPNPPGLEQFLLADIYLRVSIGYRFGVY